jgi:predicted nuclease of restriction endonuclease-like RecB superfamily
LLPDSAIPYRIVGGRVLPAFLDARDVPWLHVLVEEVDRFRALPVRELLERLRQPLPCSAPPFKLRAAMAVVLRLWKSELDAKVPPEKAREILFCAAAANSEGNRSAALAAAAQALALAPADIERALFADLPGEKLVCAPVNIPSANDLALRTNQLILRSLLFHARRVRIKAEGSTRPLVRQAKLRGLLCTVSDGAAPGTSPILDLSGPFTVFRHTLLYGRALGELVQFLPHCAHFKLRADCVLRDQEAILDVQSGDPIFPAEEPKPFDSKLEERFARDLKRAAPDWDLVREPEPVPAGGTLIFPDFLLRHRLCPQRRFLVEIMGFWSADYVARKLALLREAGLCNLILCVDETRICGDDPLPQDARIVRFRRRIDPRLVLAAAGEGDAPASGPIIRTARDPRP